MPLVRALTGEAAEQVDMVVRNAGNPDGMTISVSARPLDLGSGQDGAVAVFHDITARKHTEAELKAYAGVVAHDLKSPLTTIRGYAEIAEEALAHQPGRDTGSASRAVGKILGAAERMQRLINDLLDFTAARDAALNMVTVDLRALVDDVIATRLDGGQADDRRRSPAIYVGPLPAVNGDPLLLRQVIDNLIGNALKYTPPGQLARIDITARAANHDGQVRIQIADRGIGIPEGEHAAVFGSFHRAHTGIGYAGTGLGLAICKRIIERHGGVIAATDNPGGGAVFHFTLPAANDAIAGRTAVALDVAAA
jgi:signal transduction histidine kinase